MSLEYLSIISIFFDAIKTYGTHCDCRSTRHGLSGAGEGALHEFLLRRPVLPRLLCRRRDEMPGVALLRHRRPTGNVSLPERHAIQPSGIRLRLVVQREMRAQPEALRHQQSTLRYAHREPDQTSPADHEGASGEYLRA